MSNQIVTNEELLLSNMMEIQAIMRILERKGITNQKEIMDEIIQLKREMEEKIKSSSAQN